MTRLRWLMLACLACGPETGVHGTDDDPADDPTTAPDEDVEEEPPPDCGFAAHPEGRACVCDEGFAACPEEDDSCCSTATEFEVTIGEIMVSPYDPTTDAPWDWDGRLPGWLVDLIGAAAVYLTGTPPVAGVVQWLAAEAPELLDGTVPPDPYLWILRGETEVSDSPVEEDTYYARLDHRFELAWNGRPWVMEAWDDDVGFDDAIDHVDLFLEDLQALAGRGETEILWEGGLYQFTIRVEPMSGR
jgi:hypothetical protein